MNKEGLPDDRIREAARPRPLCDFEAARDVAARSAEQVIAFENSFPLREHKPEDAKKKRYWGDDVAK